MYTWISHGVLVHSIMQAGRQAGATISLKSVLDHIIMRVGGVMGGAY